MTTLRYRPLVVTLRLLFLTILMISLLTPVLQPSQAQAADYNAPVSAPSVSFWIPSANGVTASNHPTIQFRTTSGPATNLGYKIRLEDCVATTANHHWEKIYSSTSGICSASSCIIPQTATTGLRLIDNSTCRLKITPVVNGVGDTTKTITTTFRVDPVRQLAYAYKTSAYPNNALGTSRYCGLTIGGSGGAGCTLVSAASVLAQLNVFIGTNRVNPVNLNTWLVNNGYFNGCLMVISGPKALGVGLISTSKSYGGLGTMNDQTELRRQLDVGRWVIVGIGDTSSRHYVVVTGYTHDTGTTYTYFIHDPSSTATRLRDITSKYGATENNFRFLYTYYK